MNRFLRECAACCATVIVLTACSGGSTSAPGTTITDRVPPPASPPPAALHAEAIAGRSSVPGDYANGTLATAKFYMPVDTRPTSHLAFDKNGNLYVADKNEVIRRITPAGVVTALAGAPGKPGTADGAGAAASFNSVLGMVADAAGNVYVTDSSAVRKITPGGLVSTLAGKAGAPGNQDGQGTQAALGSVTGGLAIDGAGNLYVADTTNNAIRRVSPSGAVQALKLAVQPSQPNAVAVDPNGNLTVAQADRLLRFKPTGELIQAIGPGTSPGFLVDGAASQASFGAIQSIAHGPGGLLYVIDRGSVTIAIRTVDANGNVATIRSGSAVHGSLDGPVGSALFGSAFAGNNGIALDAAGNLFLADLGNSLIRKIAPNLQVTTFTGRSTAPPSFADGTGAAAAFHLIRGFGKDKAGNYYVADGGNCAIRKITPAHVVTTLAGAGGQCGHADGTGPAARFADIVAITQDQEGNLYIAERTTVRKLTLAGVVTTLAGTPGTTARADGQGPGAAFINLLGIAVGPDGNLLVSDGQQYETNGACAASQPRNTLRTITPQGLVATISGSDAPCSGDAGALARAGDLKFDAAGELYLVSGLALGKRTASGDASYLLDDKGQLVQAGATDGSGATTLAPDDAGNLFFVLRDEVYKYSANRVVSKAVGATGAANAIEITPDLPVSRISALTYVGNHQFLASFDDQVVMLEL